jgi:hypothetical protein
MGQRVFLPFREFALILPHLNRSEICEATGISRHVISGKLYRYNQGQDVSFTKEQSDAIRDYLFDVMDKLELILIEDIIENNEE